MALTSISNFKMNRPLCTLQISIGQETKYLICMALAHFVQVVPEAHKAHGAFSFLGQLFYQNIFQRLDM